MQQLSLQRNMLWNSTGSLFNLACQWLTTVLVVRLSSNYEAAGALSLAMAIANIYQPLALYSMRSYQVSDTKEMTSAGEYVAFRLVTMLASLFLVGIYVCITVDSSIIPVVMFYLLYRCIDVFIDVLHGVDQQHMRMDYCGKSMALRGILSLFGFCLGLSIFNNLEIAILLMAGLCFPVMIYDWKMASQFSKLVPHLTLSKLFSLLTACLPAVLGVACSSAVVTVARQKLGVLSGQEVLGVYSSVCTPVVVVQSCIRYVYAPLLGEFASKINRNDFIGYKHLFIKVLFAFVTFTIFGVFGFRLLGHLFLQIVFGSKIAEYSELLDAATISVMFCAFVSFVGDQLIALRALWGVLWANVLGFLVSLLVSQTLIIEFGMNGTSLTVIVAYIITSLVMLLFLHSSLRKRRLIV